MVLPANTSLLIYRGGTWTLPGADDMPCEGAKFHSPTPMFVHHVNLVSERWSVDAARLRPDRAWLCGTCRDNLVMLQQLLAATQGDLDWEVRREFGNDLRALALRGWRAYVSWLSAPLALPAEP